MQNYTAKNLSCNNRIVQCVRSPNPAETTSCLNPYRPIQAIKLTVNAFIIKILRPFLGRSMTDTDVYLMVNQFFRLVLFKKEHSAILKFCAHIFLNFDFELERKSNLWTYNVPIFLVLWRGIHLHFANEFWRMRIFLHKQHCCKLNILH